MDKEQRIALSEFIEDRWAEIKREEVRKNLDRREDGTKTVYSQAELARRCEMTTASLSRAITVTGIHGPNDDNLWRLHNYLQTDSRGRTVYSVVGRMEPIPEGMKEIARSVWPNLSEKGRSRLTQIAREIREQEEQEQETASDRKAERQLKVNTA